VASCSFNDLELDALQTHIQADHRDSRTVSIAVTLFSEPNPSVASVVGGHSVEGHDTRTSEGEDSGGIHEGESSVGTGDGEGSAGAGDGDEDSGLAGEDDSDSGVAGEDDDSASESPNTGLFFSRGRRPRPHSRVRTTPYSRSPSEGTRHGRPLTRRPSEPLVAGLAPLQISLPTPHLSSIVIPSPLTQLAFSRPNSKSPSKSASDDDSPMDIDQPEIGAEETTILNIASLKVIPLIHLLTLPTSLLVICTQCEVGLTSQGALTHSKATHSIILSKDQKTSIEKVLSKPGIIKTPAGTYPPKPPCPPIDGLKSYQGISCILCRYCCITQASFTKHFSEEHRSGGQGNANSNFAPATIQALSLQRPKYFAVIPVLSGMDEDNLFSVYLQQCAPQIDSLQLLNPPLDHNEVPPLLVVTGWHIYLASYTSNRTKLRQLLELMQLPTSTRGEAWMGGPLRNTVEAYLKDATKKGNDADLDIRCVLMECPRSVLF